MNRLGLLVLALGAATLLACGDDGVRVTPKTCAEDPTLPNCPSCRPGKVKGRICAPDRQTFVAGADVYASGTCGETPYSMHTIADAAGNFELTLPEGDRQLLARSGSFERTYTTKVVANTTSELPADSLCFDRESAKIAVVTGHGDKIEELLVGLGFEITIVPGKRNDFYEPGGGKEFLLDLEKLKKQDVLFIDCGAGVKNSKIDFAGAETKIGENLKAFVEGGGSLYASDWAFAFVKQAFKDDVFMKFGRGGGWSLPFDTDNLMGYAPQTIDASVLDDPLAEYLGKDSVKVTFPSSPPSFHWGLVERVSDRARTLVEGDAKMCTGECRSASGELDDAPLAVQLDLTPGVPGGAVIYTSFHNIAQETGDVGNILKYLIFKL